MKHKYILFDLDGTLTDPKVGITSAVAYSLKKLKGIEANLDDLTTFIGPPLKESFTNFYGFSEREADLAIEYYREYFADKGIFENEVYPGIHALLEDLKNTGAFVMAVATSKPTIFANRIIKHFGLEGYFSCVVGSNLDGSRVKKAEVIAEVLSQLHVDDKREAIMIGDREHDVIGAKQVGIDVIGVAYGYGTYEELEYAGADFIVSQIIEIKELLL